MMLLGKLFQEARKVDAKLVFNPVEVGDGENINTATDIPTNMADLGKHIKICGNNKNISTPQSLEEECRFR